MSTEADSAAAPRWLTVTRAALPVVWNAVLVAGAVVIFGYSAHLGYFPDLDLAASAGLFAATAAAGGLLLAVLGWVLCVPAVLWHLILDVAGEHAGMLRSPPGRVAPALWFVTPVAAFVGGAIVFFRTGPAPSGWVLTVWGLIVAVATSVVAGCVTPLGNDREPIRLTPIARWRRGATAGAAIVVSALVLDVPVWWFWRLGDLANVGEGAPTPATPAQVGLAAAVILFVNAALFVRPREATAERATGEIGAPGGDPTAGVRPTRRALPGVVGWRAFVVVLGGAALAVSLNLSSFVARRAMALVGAGPVERAALVTDQVGCDALTAFGQVPVGRTAAGCTFENVPVDSRVGTSYVIRRSAHASGVEPTRFTLSKQHVTSFGWSEP